MNKENEILEFITRRFPQAKNSDSNWLNGNCYYFSLILKDRFSSHKPEIYYDVINGHFLTLIKDTLYDASGIAYKLSNYEMSQLSKTQLWHPFKLEYGDMVIVNWQYFHLYDSKQYNRIILDCLV